MLLRAFEKLLNFFSFRYSLLILGKCLAVFKNQMHFIIEENVIFNNGIFGLFFFPPNQYDVYV